MELLALNIEDTKKTIVQRIFEHGKNSPEKIAIICKDETVSYADLCDLIFNIAEWLKNNNVVKGDRVAIQSIHDKYCVAAYYAIHYLGAILVPLEKNAPEERVLEIANEVEAKLIISSKKADVNNWHLYSELSDYCQNKKTFSFDELVFPSLDDYCEMVFTTGTTGKSKGVLITHKNISWYAYSVAKRIEMKKDNRFFITTPLNFVRYIQ